MAFIVEFIHGRKDSLSVDELGNLINSNDYAYFSLGGIVWEKILEVGKENGWMPQGTILRDSIDTNNPVRSDYEPSSWGYEPYKVFVKEDASNLANALSKYVQRNVDEQQNGLSVTIGKAMIEFLKFGDFIFLWDD